MYGEHRKAVRQFYVLCAILPVGVLAKAMWDAYHEAPERVFTYHAPLAPAVDLRDKQAWPWAPFTGGRDSVPVEPRQGDQDTGHALALPAAALAALHACPLTGAACQVSTRPNLLVGADRPGRRLPNGDWLAGHEHKGIDLPGAGNDVQATWPGVVDSVVEDRDGSSGLMVVVRSNLGGLVLYHKYMHLASVASGLRPGVSVRVREKLGVSGASGVKQSAAHLHYEVRSQAEGGSFYDPTPLIH
ncbi:MAG: M23 family metallopeptidase [Candidatus Magasanikbacteria bacterium]|nr:M23 family metallopeptidase [Candidatus Magasanikbacteria bacterium]